MVGQKVVIVDCKGHLLGRLASHIVKQLQAGQKIVCVRTEEINISGSLFRNKLKFEEFLRKRMNTNPRRGPFHYRAPGKLLWRTVRGMMRHKTQRAAACLERLKVFEGVPHPYDKLKRMVVPDAMRVLRLKPGRKYCRLGDLSSSFGWKHDELIKSLENKRKVKSAAYYTTKKEVAKIQKQAIVNKEKELAPIVAALAQYGH